METKEMKIVPPEGYEIDKENSTFKCIKFKKNPLTYEDVAKELFESTTSYYITGTGKIAKNEYNCYYKDPNTATSKKQLEKLLAINKLMNVAKYLNGDWKPDWSNDRLKYYIGIKKGKLIMLSTYSIQSAEILFRSEKLAQQAIDILGEDTIRLALSTDW